MGCRIPALSSPCYGMRPSAVSTLCASVSQLADAGGDIQAPALKSFEVKREPVPGELLSASARQ